ncbi:MAG: hypothetical protein J1G06_07535 [Oscillospiraceae bacterium]|nr:hypothetical protein [Oscillospiraceae bacterium]
MKVIIDYRTSEKAVSALYRLGCEVIKTIPIDRVYPEIDGHPDIQLHIVNNKVICAPQVYEYYKQMIPEYQVIRGSAELCSKYPYDIAYNVCRIGKYAVCNMKNTAKEIIAEYDNILNTKQGYAKCSICVVSDNAVITADEGIYRLLKSNDIDALKIAPGNIDLYGMQGFIGGASGLLKPNLLTFNGNLHEHPDSDRIKKFCSSHGVEVACLHSDRLTDIGSILVL